MVPERKTVKILYEQIQFSQCLHLFKMYFYCPSPNRYNSCGAAERVSSKLRCGLQYVSEDKRLGTSHFLRLNTLRVSGVAAAAVPDDSGSNSGTLSLRRRIIAAGNAAEQSSLARRARGTQTMLCPGVLAVVGEELEVDASSSSERLVTPIFGVKSQGSRFNSARRLFTHRGARLSSLWSFPSFFKFFLFTSGKKHTSLF